MIAGINTTLCRQCMNCTFYLLPKKQWHNIESRATSNKSIGFADVPSNYKKSAVPKQCMEYSSQFTDIRETEVFNNCNNSGKCNFLVYNTTEAAYTAYTGCSKYHKERRGAVVSYTKQAGT